MTTLTQSDLDDLRREIEQKPYGLHRAEVVLAILDHIAQLTAENARKKAKKRLFPSLCNPKQNAESLLQYYAKQGIGDTALLQALEGLLIEFVSNEACIAELTADRDEKTAALATEREENALSRAKIEKMICEQEGAICIENYYDPLKEFDIPCVTHTPGCDTFISPFDALVGWKREADARIAELEVQLSPLEPGTAPQNGWTCFHCGEHFGPYVLGQVRARAHFGACQDATPACQIKGADERGLLYALRRAEEELERYRVDDSDKDREIHGLIADHAVALRREEEKGYERGVKDARLEAQSSAQFVDGMRRAAEIATNYDDEYCICGGVAKAILAEAALKGERR